MRRNHAAGAGLGLRMSRNTLGLRKDATRSSRLVGEGENLVDLESKSYRAFSFPDIRDIGEKKGYIEKKTPQKGQGYPQCRFSRTRGKGRGAGKKKGSLVDARKKKRKGISKLLHLRKESVRWSSTIKKGREVQSRSRTQRVHK